MKIERVECIPMVYHMEHPIYSGTGRCDARQLLLVRIYADNVINKDGKDGIWNLRSEL